jgi:hypothetical protein
VAASGNRTRVFVTHVRCLSVSASARAHLNGQDDLAVPDRGEHLLAKYAQTVGCRRSPGVTVTNASAAIGPRRTLLWSARWSTTTGLGCSSRSQVHTPPSRSYRRAGLPRLSVGHRALTGRTERARTRFTGWTLGYGYQPWRALVGLVAVIAAAIVLAITVGGHGGLIRTHPSPPTASRCSTVERVGVGLDISLPLIKTGARDHCDVSNTATGQAMTVAGWGLQLLAWAFATLFVVGFTGAVRKT